MDAADGVERRDGPAAEAEAHVGRAVQVGADEEAGPQRVAEGGVDALELVTEGDDGGVVDGHVGVGPRERRLDGVVQGLPVAVRARLDDVADERHR